MTTEKFSLDDFKKALPQSATSDGLVNGEYVFHWQVSPGAAIKIRSSVDRSGYAASTGEDSIRFWLVNSSD